MEIVIQKWGNSNAIRIPKKVLDELKIKESDIVELTTNNNTIVIKKTNKHMTLKERYEKYYNMPFSKIKPHKNEEINWGKTEGEEIW